MKHPNSVFLSLPQRQRSQPAQKAFSPSAMKRQDGNEDTCYDREAGTKASPQNPRAGRGAGPGVRAVGPPAKDALEGHLKGHLFSLPSLQEFSVLI